MKHRCAWATTAEMAEYHDREWGVPRRDDLYLFEMITLEGAQAGLSWRTVLAKRENYRRALADFDPQRLVRFTPARRARLVENAGLIRHRGKLDSVFTNARAVIQIQREHGSFAAYVWSFTDAGEMSRSFLKHRLRFVGPTICYAFMQAVGMVNDHEPGCFRRIACSKLGARTRRPR